jgi:methyltransferase (TIGR00027 family)
VTDLGAIERTALLTAALRATETMRPDRLYEDPFAAALAGDTGLNLLAEIHAATFPARGPRTVPSTPDYNAIRTRFFDDFLLAAAARPEIRQIVLAPAGMDSRSYRLRWPHDLLVYEIDKPAVLAVKEHVLSGRAAHADRRAIAADMMTDGWTEGLLAAGYDPGLPSAWLLEGILYYIPEAAVHRVLGRVRGVSAPGSLVAADVVNAAALTLPSMRPLLDVFAGWGCPWLFGTDEPEALFRDFGITARATQPGEPGADFGRWPDPVPPRSVTGVRRVFFVHGERHPGLGDPDGATER